jgi:hypothetical protein
VWWCTGDEAENAACGELMSFFFLRNEKAFAGSRP